MRRIFCEVTGKYIEIPDKPSRVISFAPAVTEILFELGLGSKIIGVSAFCVRPEEAQAKKKVGSYSHARLSLIKEMDPDIIFTITGYQRDFALRLSESFPVFALELPVSLSGIIDTVLKVGLVMGEYERARRIQRRLMEDVLKVGPLDRSVRAYIEIDFGNPTSFGAYSYITDALSIIGATNIFGNEPVEWLIPDFKTVAKEEPDIIIYEPKMFSKFKDEDLGRILKERGWEYIKAVKKGNVHVTPRPYDFLAHHGPSFITKALKWLREKMSLT